MSAYYDKTKNMICIRELYSDFCEVDNDVNLFFTSIRSLLRSTSGSVDIEAKLIDFMCDSSIIYPGEFISTEQTNRKTLVSDITNLGINKQQVEQFVSEVVKIANQQNKPTIFLDSDPRTNKKLS